MNRYIITREWLRGQEYIISALYDENKKMLEVLPELGQGSSILGNIYIGKVENIVQNLNAAFVKIGANQNCYLSFEDIKNPIFTKKISDKKMLVSGDELLVQVSRESIKTKEPAVTTNLSFGGMYAVLTSGNRRRSVSSKLSAEERTHYLKLLEQIKKEAAETEKGIDFGIIIRTNAKEASDEAILAEIQMLKEQYSQLVQTARYKICYSCLYRQPPSYLRHLKNLRKEELTEVITDDCEVFSELCHYYRIPKQEFAASGSAASVASQVETADGLILQHYADDMLALSALYSVKAGLENALKERVWLKSGAYLVIQPTEALTVVDVNTGKNTAKKNVQENFLKVNKEAALEIARQLRLRNISGMILIDFINLASKEAEAELLKVFRKALKADPVPTKLVDITKLGLVEVTRKKGKKSILEILAEQELPT